VILALAVLGIGAWFLLFRPGAPIDIGIGRSVPDFSFQLVRVNGAAVTPGNEVDLDGAAEEVRETVDALYVAGFIDPGKWEDGAFPEVLEQFDRRAAEQASVDLPFLSLGGEADRVEFVEPAVGKMNVRFLVDPDANPAGAVATTRFVADGQFDDGRPMFVLHNGTYYLRRAGGRWVITGYDVNGVVQPGRRPTGAPTAAPSPGATP
jgi:hypothetical protein